MIDCQASLRDAVDAGAGVDRIDAQKPEPVLVDVGEAVRDLEAAQKKENQRKLEEGDEFEVINHEKDEELREKGDAEKAEDMKAQVLEVTCNFDDIVVQFMLTCENTSKGYVEN